MTSSDGQYLLEIVLPLDISRDDQERLRSCKGKILLVPALRRKLLLNEVDYQSYRVHGREPDFASLLAAYKRRFPVLITNTERNVLRGVALSIGYPRGLLVANTGPVDLGNGDFISLFPPIGDLKAMLQLPSCGSQLMFAITLPLDAAKEVMGKIFAVMTYEFCARNQIRAPRPVETYTVLFRGKTINIEPMVTEADALRTSVHSLFSTMSFAVHEGIMILFAMMPTLLAEGKSDQFINSLLQMNSLTRLSVQLFNPPSANLPEPGRGAVANNVFEMISAWLDMVMGLGHLLNLKPVLKVCMYYADSATVKENESFTAIIP